ncbi:biotin-dependent carboxyltransferase family protein [Alkalihalobacillus sp. NPDC078783]
MSIHVMKPGMQTTIQDLGRHGYMNQGVSVTGAMDSKSLRVANLLVGNKEGEACLEMTLTGPSLSFDEDLVMAIAGGGMIPVLNGKRRSLHTPLFVPKGSYLHFEPVRKGCRAYLSVAGGFDVPVQLGSKSTYIRAKIGGFEGRALEKGDVLDLLPMSNRASNLMERLSKDAKPLQWRVAHTIESATDEPQLIRVIKGSHFDQFTTESQKLFLEKPFQLSTQSDRMGYRLETEERIELANSFELLSEAVALGTVQLPPSGKPIILLADRQSTGGYPRIAQVMLVDIPKLAQMRPGEWIQFTEVSLQEAEQIYLQSEKELAEIKVAIQLKGV